uniref:Potassium channel domain-containing protein n=2 Tax=Panagrolaimus sp. JU765 TaxID=591449 RepID=A0AC34Q1P1_9BILA
MTEFFFLTISMFSNLFFYLASKNYSLVVCVESIIHSYPKQNRTELAQLITDYCFIRANYDGRSIWNFKNAFLFGFGIITTLGYGLIEPMTINGRMFTVIFGFIGIPITVIMLTNFGRYLQNLEVYMSHRFFNNKAKDGEDSQETDELEQISMTLLFSTVFLYLIVGAIFIPIFNGQFDFFNGIYYAYLCLTALEFGELIPKENEKAIPIIILYIELGLAISTIALDLGSTYVRRLYYIGRKVHNLSSIKIWFGAKE